MELKKLRCRSPRCGICLCGGKLGWSGDFVANETGLGNESQVSSLWHCNQCGNDVWFVSPNEEEA